MQVLCDPGDVVLVEEPTYFVFMEMPAGFGIEVVPYLTRLKPVSILRNLVT